MFFKQAVCAIPKAGAGNPYIAEIQKLRVSDITDPEKILRKLCQGYLLHNKEYKALASNICSANSMQAMIACINQEILRSPLKEYSNFHNLLIAFFTEPQHTHFLQQLNFSLSDELLILENRLGINPEKLLEKIKQDIAATLRHKLMSKDPYFDEVNAAVHRNYGETAILLLIEIFPHLKLQQATIAKEFYHDIILFIHEYNSPFNNAILANLIHLVNLFLPFLSIIQLEELYPKTNSEKFVPLLLSLISLDWSGYLNLELSSKTRQESYLAKNILTAIIQYVVKRATYFNTVFSRFVAENDAKVAYVKHLDDAVQHPFILTLNKLMPEERTLLERLERKIIVSGNGDSSLYRRMSKYTTEMLLDNYFDGLNSVISDLDYSVNLNKFIVGEIPRDALIRDGVAIWYNVFNYLLLPLISKCRMFVIMADAVNEHNLVGEVLARAADFLSNSEALSNPIRKIFYCFILQQLRIPIDLKILLSVKDMFLSCLKPEANIFQKKFSFIMLGCLDDSFVILFKTNLSLANDLCLIITYLKKFFTEEFFRQKISSDSLRIVEAARYYASDTLGRFVNILSFGEYDASVLSIFDLLVDFRAHGSLSIYLENFLSQLTQQIVDNDFAMKLLDSLWRSSQLCSQQKPGNYFIVDVQRICKLISHVVNRLMAPDNVGLAVKNLLMRPLTNNQDDIQAPSQQMQLYYVRATLFNTQQQFNINVREIFETLSSAHYLQIKDLAGLVCEYAGLFAPKISATKVSLQKDNPINKGAATAAAMPSSALSEGSAHSIQPPHPPSAPSPS